MTAARISHEDARLLMAAGIDGDLTPSQMLELRAHLAACDACRADEQAFRRDNARLATVESVRPPNPVVRAAVMRAAAGAADRRRAGFGWAPSLAGVAATLALAVGAWWLAFGRPLPDPGVPSATDAGRASIAPSPSGASPSTPSPVVAACRGEPFARVVTPTGSAGAGPWDLAVADFNEDGIEDVAVVMRDPGAVGIMLGDGNGGFSQPRPFTPRDPNPLAGADQPSIRAADMTGDGNMDVVVTNDTAGRVILYAGDGAGGLGSPGGADGGEPRSFSVGGRPQDVAVGQFAGDSMRDLVIADATGNALILVGRGRGTMETGPAVRIAGSPVEIAAADLDGDGRDDIVIANEVDPGLVVLLQVTTGTFGQPLSLDAPAGSDVDLVDLDDDGDLDAVLANATPSSVSVLLGDGAGSFGAPRAYPLQGGEPRSSITLDLDGDGDLDIIAKNGTSDDLAILVGNGRGTFEVLAPVVGGEGPTGLVAGDFDRDGRTDLVTSNITDNSVSVFLNDCRPTRS